jgi:hypothetical protein
LTRETNPFLLGRSLWFAGRFAHAIKPNLVEKFLDATVAGLQPQQDVIVRIQASRAIFEFVVKTSETTEHLMVPRLGSIFENLIDIAAKASDEVASFTLEVLNSCIDLDETTSAKYSSNITDLILICLHQKSNDPHISSIAEDLVESVAKLPSASGVLCSKLVPFIQQSLSIAEDIIDEGETSMTNTTIATCLDITTRLVRYIPKPVPHDIITALYPIVIEKTLKSNDTQIIQSGGETVRGFFSSCGGAICEMSGGLDAAEKVILHLLAPDQPEFSASFAGRLVTLIVMQAKSQNIKNILTAVLVKLNTVQTLTVQQSLLLVFARLAVADANGLLQFLNEAQATQALLQLWLEKQSDIFGAYERRVTVAGLCKLIELGCAGNETIQQTQFRKIKQNETKQTRQTRSKTKGNEQFIQIPWITQAILIITTEWAGQKERDTQNEDDSFDDDSDDEIEAADEQGGDETAGILLSDLLNCRDFEEFEGEEEEDVKNDPINQIDICDHISNSIRSVSNTNIAKEVVGSLDDTAKGILQNLVE